MKLIDITVYTQRHHTPLRREKCWGRFNFTHETTPYGYSGLWPTVLLSKLGIFFSGDGNIANQMVNSTRGKKYVKIN